MKRLTRTAAALCCCIFAAESLSPLPVFAEYPQGTLHAAVYDENGALITENISFLLTGSTPEMQRYGSSFRFGSWNISNENPADITDIDIRDGWEYHIGIGSQSHPVYRWAIDTERTETTFTFDETQEHSVDIYLKRSVKERFLIYRGTYGESQLPVFDYYYPLNSTAKPDNKRRVVFAGEMEGDLTYGDVFVPAEPPVLTNIASALYEIPAETEISRLGTCAEVFDTLPLRVGHIGHTVSQLAEEQPEGYQVFLEDESGSVFSYRSDYTDIDTPLRLSEDIKIGDTLTFAMHNGIVMLPLEIPEHIPALMGDLNEDNEVDEADLRLLERFLLSAPETDDLTDWRAADFSGDRVLNAADLSLLRAAVQEALSLPRCEMTLDTRYGGFGVMGQDLGSGERQDTYFVKAGDRFFESERGEWHQNPKDVYRPVAEQIAEIVSFDDEGVTVSILNRNGEPEEVFCKYGESLDIYSLFVVYDGINYDYTLTFAPLSEPEATAAI